MARDNVRERRDRLFSGPAPALIKLADGQTEIVVSPPYVLASWSVQFPDAIFGVEFLELKHRPRRPPDEHELAEARQAPQLGDELLLAVLEEAALGRFGADPVNAL